MNSKAKRVRAADSAMLDTAMLNQAPVLKPRQALLREADSITSADRNSQYGNPEYNFQNIADRWNLYLACRFPELGPRMAELLTPQDVGTMMIDMKLARLSTNPFHRDSLVDIAGYAACTEDCRVAAINGASK